MARFQIILFWLAAYSVRFGTCNLELPHPQCTYNNRDLSCAGAVLDIPHSFNVTLIPVNVTSITLNCPGASRQSQCNMMRGDLQPLPYRNELVSITLYGFRTDNGQLLQPNLERIPVPQLLTNLKHRIKDLRIHLSRIGFLDGEFLRGFRSLESLYLNANDINTIDVHAFQFLIDPSVPTPSAALDVRIPKLSHFFLWTNNLQDLDWAVFRPVARTMIYINIQDQQPGLSSLRRTGPPFSMNLIALSFQRNFLREIPPSVLETVAPIGGRLFVQDNKMCPYLPAGDCSCCEMLNLIKWIERNSRSVPVWSTHAAYFSCGNGSSILTQNSTFPLAKFTKCPETHTIATFPYRSCYTPKPLRIECTLGRFELSSSVRITTDAGTVIFASDGRHQCDSILYDLHHKVLEMAGIPIAATTGSDALQVTCQNGTLRIKEEDPDAYAADKITFEVDSSLACNDHLHDFADFVYVLSQNNTGNVESSPALPIDDWLSDFLICTDAEPLVMNCTAGVLTSSEKNLTHSPAITLLLHTDNSLDCRLVLRNVHWHILDQEMVQVSEYAYADREDAVVAVLQHGVTVISENQPNQSTRRNLKYYSAPNRLSRNKFRKLMELLQSFLGTGSV